MLWVLYVACGSSEPSTPAAPAAPAPAAEAPAARPTRTERSAEAQGPPRITGVSLAPARPTAADAIVATPALLGDAGPAPSWSFEWRVDGLVVPGAIRDTLPAGKARRGQKVEVTATLDGFDSPITGTSDALTIANQPPRLLTDAGDLAFVDGYILKAEDPDGEPLKWRLEGGPTGMSIDQKGVLHYKGSPDEKGGTYAVKIFAEDTGRDFVAIDLPLTLTPGSTAVRKAEEEKKKAEEEKKKATEAAKAPAK